MYLQRPVVVTNCTSLERIVTETDCGVVVPYGDVDAMARALIALAQDPKRARELGQNGHRAVTERYNRDATVRPMINMYKELTG